MPTTLQFRRGTTSQNNSFTGALGELSIDTQLDVIRVHDGSTAGGAMELTGNTATQTLTNKTLTSPVLTTPTVATSITINAAGEVRFGDDNTSNYVGFKSPGTVSSNVIWTLPSEDGTSGQALVSNGSGVLSFAAAGATVSGDTSTDTDFAVYFAATTSGSLTAVKQDTGLLYNPSTGTLTSSVFAGEATSAKYADLAERYQADAEYLPGTVLIFGGDAEVTQSTERMDRRAAGVVSTDPAYLMNSSLVGKNTVTLALTGRVPCKVSGYVRKGDLMVSGVDNGVAEAWREESSPPAGSIIGKSLEDKDSRRIDVIEVVIGAK
tara:strand:- start:1482 stop:2447 length:966 start_codon:yes stop_codon:yes gene_type:complete